MGCEPGPRNRVEESPLPQSSQASLAPSASVPQERLEAARQALSEARKQSSSLGEQVQTMRGELSDLELQRVEAEGQLQQLQEVRGGAGTFPPISASSQTQAQPPGRRDPHNPRVQE